MYIIIVQIIFTGPLGSLSSLLVILKIEFRLNRCLGGVAGVANSIYGHEQTQQNRVYYFNFFDVVLAFKESTIRNLLASPSNK